MMICIGGVCIPLNLLIPFLVGVLHRYGWFQWFKQEWVTVGETTEKDAGSQGAADTELQKDTKKVEKAVDEATAKADADESQADGALRKRVGKDQKGKG